MKICKIIGLVTLVGMLGACGYKSDLYLAGDKPSGKPATSKQKSDETKQKELKTNGTRG